uniref:NADH-ubiquinone oxidoreductase chain 1 n=1 Tax=Obrimoposthia wandeli TaxID=2136291 RepID=A0A7D6BYZ2_9PLAT|nr:NADH dehydrogenase subunit 1 [Obrimoposthia wandeli]QLJ92326.1 NADH dehydrogenase subunit 1 [Obrimoposthia wandeli]
MLFFVNYIFLVVSVLLSVVFITMLERKIMSYIQIRKGPNKVGFLGLLTPLADAIKLLVKYSFQPGNTNIFVFWTSSLFSVILLFTVWFFFPVGDSNNNFYFGLLVFFCVSSLNVYSNLGSGWGSNSKYSLLGSLRGAAQVISYEVGFIFLVFFLVVWVGNYNLFFFNMFGFFFWVVFSFLFFIWFMFCVAETNRAPFDFSEGESELVSGFNTEYGALGFAFLFLGEYGNIIFISFLTILLWF